MSNPKYLQRGRRRLVPPPHPNQVSGPAPEPAEVPTLSVGPGITLSPTLPSRIVVTRPASTFPVAAAEPEPEEDDFDVDPHVPDDILDEMLLTEEEQQADVLVPPAWNANMKKADLLAVAADLGLEVTASNTKAEIVTALKEATA